MRDLPDELDTDALIRSLADGWGFNVATIEYAPVGFGSYHWIVSDVAGSRAFVTADDLDRKPWLGSTRDSAFDGLGRAFGTAVGLRDAGLDFVLAPILTRNGEALRRVGTRHSITLFPFVEGRAAEFGAYENPEDRAAVVTMVARIHRATSAVASLAPRIDLDIPDRVVLERALKDVRQTWFGGTYSEPARQSLAEHATDVADLLGLFDQLAREVATRTLAPVITHGEPHAANVIRTETSRLLIDWDTVGLAPPERDLWMVVADSDGATAYADATGHLPDVVSMDFFRLTWDLADLAGFINVLRAPHRDGGDAEKAYNGVRKCVAIRDQWAALL